METIIRSRSREVVISGDRPFVMIGERINPTGRKVLAAEMRAGVMNRVKADAIAQVQAGAQVLDVNAGVPMVDEPALLVAAIKAISEVTDVPICIDSSVIEALEAALGAYEGKALVNSVTAEDERMDRILPVVKKHGAAVIGMSNDEYRHITYDLTMSVAQLLAQLNPEMTFCYVTGAGTDSSEQGRTAWARVKGGTENALIRLFKQAYMFRPAGIQPLHGIRSKTAWYQAVYVIAAPLLTLLNRIAPKYMTTTEQVGRAMIKVARDGYPKPVLESEDINRL